MIRLAVCLAAIAQMSLTSAMAQMPAARPVSVSNAQVGDPNPTLTIRSSQRANETSPCAAGSGPMGLGSLEAAIRSAPTTNVLWNEIQSSRSTWINLEYLGVWVKGSHEPSHVTIGPNGASPSSAGSLGQPAATISFGDQHLSADMRSGGRITCGRWLVDDTIGVEASFFGLETAAAHSSATAGAR